MKTYKTLGRTMVWLGVVLGLGLALPCAMAKTTAATNSGDWATAAIWNNGAPVAGDDVAINASKTVTVSTAVGNFASFTVNGTLTFTNWDTSLSATTVTIASGGLVTLPPAFTTSQMSNRVYFICTDFMLASNATINVDYKGWSGGISSGVNGYGPGGGMTSGTESGGGHGGTGGHARDSGASLAGGTTNDSINAPMLPGSGAGGTAHGGGVIYISAAGQVLINGTMTAMGAGGGGLSPNNIGGGAGGSIYINCQTFVATTGVIRANGGDGANSGGGGGGGCIAIVCNNPSAQQALPRSTVSISCSGGSVGGGTGGFWTYAGQGTVYANCENVLPGAWAGGASFFGFTAFSPSFLSISNATLIFTERPTVQVANDLSVVANGKLAMYDANLSVGGNMLVSNANVYAYRGTNLAVRPSLSVAGNLTFAGTTTNAALYVYAGTTNNGVGTNYDVSVSVGGTLSLVTNAWVYPTSNPTNGGSIKFSAKNVTLAATNTGFIADGLGYAGGPVSNSANGYGPGGGIATNVTAGGGGGYGGTGGKAAWGGAGGGTYGLSNAPVFSGSGGGGCTGHIPTSGGNGGGLIWVDASQGTITLNGKMTANAGITPNGYGSGGGSGGGIYLLCKSFAGAATGMLNANGGTATGWGGPGGGGRIAVLYTTTNSWFGSAIVNGAAAADYLGSRTNGANGTIVWTYMAPKGTSVIIQ